MLDWQAGGCGAETQQQWSMEMKYEDSWISQITTLTKRKFAPYSMSRSLEQMKSTL